MNSVLGHQRPDTRSHYQFIGTQGAVPYVLLASACQEEEGRGGWAKVATLLWDICTHLQQSDRVNKRRRFVKPVWTLLARRTQEEKKLMRSILAAWDRCIQNSCLLAWRTCEHHAKRRTKINSTNADIRPIQECVSSRSTSQSVTVLKWCPLLGWWDFYFLTS